MALPESTFSRRHFLHGLSALSGVAVFGGDSRWGGAADPPDKSDRDDAQTGFRLRYILGSPMYGKAPLAEVLPDARKIGATHIDVWPMPHANHLEQAIAMGAETFAELLAKHDVALGVVSRYDLTPSRIGEGLSMVKQFGGQMLITGAGGGKGESEQDRVRTFLESMKPQIDMAEELGLVIGIENHSKTWLHSPDSIRCFAELATSPHIGLAMAPYHLPQRPGLIAKLIEDVGPKLIFFQAWEHGMGCAKKLPKEEEVLQMPGRGTLDFAPILAALAKIDYQGWTEIFMHPVPRGVPIRKTTAEVTTEINRARAYLEQCLARGNA